LDALVIRSPWQLNDKLQFVAFKFSEPGNMSFIPVGKSQGQNIKNNFLMQDECRGLLSAKVLGTGTFCTSFDDVFIF
jgi:hypothetical protein